MRRRRDDRVVQRIVVRIGRGQRERDRAILERRHRLAVRDRRVVRRFVETVIVKVCGSLASMPLVGDSTIVVQHDGDRGRAVDSPTA